MPSTDVLVRGARALVVAVFAAALAACGVASGGSTLEATTEGDPVPLATPCGGGRTCATSGGTDVSACEAQLAGACAAEWQAWHDCRARFGCGVSASSALAGELACDDAFDRARACDDGAAERPTAPPPEQPLAGDEPPGGQAAGTGGVRVVDLARLGGGARLDLLLVLANEGAVATASLDRVSFGAGLARVEVSAAACDPSADGYVWHLAPGQRTRPLGLRLAQRDGSLELELACRDGGRARLLATGALDLGAPLDLTLEGTLEDGRPFRASASPRLL